MHYQAAEGDCGPTVSVVGTIRNDSDIPWQSIYVEVQYFDSDGALIDADGAQQYGLVIAPGEVSAFRVRSGAARSEHEYATHQALVRSANDARPLF